MIKQDQACFVYHNMDAFNIKISTQEKEVTLTILPKDDEYHIIYFGGIIGALTINDETYTFIEPEKLKAGELPLYDYKKGEITEEELILNQSHIHQIFERIRDFNQTRS